MPKKPPLDPRAGFQINDRLRIQTGPMRGLFEQGEPGTPAAEFADHRLEDRRHRFRAVPFGANGMPLPELNLYPFFQAFAQHLPDTGDEVREELKKLLPLATLGGAAYW